MSNLLIVGASARAAAQSAARAGFRVHAVDLFCDVDLGECAHSVRCGDFHELLALAKAMPPGAWMYTGGLENYPRIVEAIAAERLLWGNGAGALRRVRDPVAVAACLTSRDLPAVEAVFDRDAVPKDEAWLRKPLRSAGGTNITHYERPASGNVAASRTEHSRGWYFQRLVTGQPASAIFVAARGRAALLGVTEQVTGLPWATKPFQYAGSIGPLAISVALEAQLAAIGDALADEFLLVGLFGIDGIVAGDEFRLVEVNPRYTASCEVVERITGVNMVAVHAAACADGVLPERPRSTAAAAKRILFAAREIIFDPSQLAGLIAEHGVANWDAAADVPVAGERIVPGQPICTLLAFGDFRDVRRIF